MYNHFNFKKLEDKILVTNDCGAYKFLSTEEFNTFITSPDLLEDSLKYSLVENGFFLPDSISHTLYDGFYKKLIKKYVFTALLVL